MYIISFLNLEEYGNRTYRSKALNKIDAFNYYDSLGQSFSGYFSFFKDCNDGNGLIKITESRFIREVA
tara:strand:- start:497 stop:700 length:204 start_codon:yes stop_codon:yes gene_type:complete